ncbi:MAG: hypothetical protein JOZ70_02480 [Pseudolabrys sp.]|nr:hypothetical protein [Pseudolabrys sp.]
MNTVIRAFPHLADLDHPVCACGAPMRLLAIEPAPDAPHTTIHLFECTGCQVELRVMHDDTPKPSEQASAA